MSIAKVVEVSSKSKTSFTDAAENAIKEVSKTIKNVKHAWIKDFEIDVQEDGTMVYKANCKITFIVNTDG